MWIRGFAAEFFPVILFLGGNIIWDFFVGVSLMVGAAVVSFIYLLVAEKRIPFFALISTSFVSVFGLISLKFQNADIFKLTDTFLDGFYAIVLAFSVWSGHPILETLFKPIFALKEQGWRVLTIRWSIFFAIIAITNEIVRRNCTTETWVYYKSSMFFAVMIFGLYQFRLAMRTRIEAESNKYGLRTAPEGAGSGEGAEK